MIDRNDPRGIATLSRLAAGAVLLALGACGSVPPAARPAAKGGRPGSDLARLMDESVNRASTQISFQIFHNRQAREEDRFESIARQAQLLSGTAEHILEFKPPCHSDELEDYTELAVTLRHCASGLREAAVERNMDQAVLWFWHVKNSCANCHDVYRFGEIRPLRRSIAPVPDSNP